MENKNWNLSNQTNFETTSVNTSQTFMSKVFAWMFAALAVTSVTAFYVAGNESIIKSLITETGPSILGWVVMLAPLGFVLAMGLGFNKFSFATLVVLFLSYAIIMGVSLSFILLIYTATSIFSTFLITSLMFGGMAVVGYTTKTDLTKFGSLMMMGLWGLIIASVVNFFLKSDTMEYIMSFIGVAVFTGLTAYDVQKLKNIGNGMEYGDESSKKISIMGALNLYLDFVNLFLFLLRFFGAKKD